mgnify:CR=1 FL=1
MKKTEVLKRLFVDYSREYLNKILLSGFFSILAAGSKSAISWLLDPAIEKSFIEKVKTLILIMPVMIVIAFTTKGTSLYFAKAIMVSVAEAVTMNL